MQMLWDDVPYDGYHLLAAVFTSFDFDVEEVERLVGNEDLSKILFVRGDGLFNDKENSPIQGRLKCIAYPLIDDFIAESYFHAKVHLALLEDDKGERVFLLRVGSRNLYPFDNLECQLVFIGKKEAGSKDKNTSVLRDFLADLSMNIEGDHVLDTLLQNLDGMVFTPIGDSYLDTLAQSASSMVFILPRHEETGIFQEPYEEILVISPNLSPSLLNDLSKKSKLTVVTQPLMASKMILKGVDNIRWSLPKGNRYVHAKLFLGKKKDGSFDLYLGSMNLTEYAVNKNDEFMIRLNDVKGIKDISSFLPAFLGEEYDDIDLASYSDLPDVFLDAFTFQTRIQYFTKFVHRKRFNEEEQSRAASFFLTSSCVRLLASYYRNGLPPLTYREKKTNDKLRPLYVLSKEGTWAFGLLNHCLHRYDDCFSKSVYLHVLQRNAVALFALIRQNGGLQDYYLFRGDIHAFDPSISEKLLIDSINEHFDFDPKLRDFLRSIAEKKDYMKPGDDTVYLDAPAQKTGFPLAGLFENVVLSDLDKRLEQEAEIYVRYGDDIIIASKKEKELLRLRDLYVSLLGKKGLSLSEKKCFVVRPGEAVEFLGFEIRRGEIDVTPNFFNQILVDLGGFKKSALVLFKQKQIPPFLRIKPTLKYLEKKLNDPSIEKAFSIISTTDTLRIIDARILDVIRTIVTGKEGKGKYRLSYEELQRYGYRSLVNRYYQFIK